MFYSYWYKLYFSLQVFETLKNIFGPKMTSYMIVIITGKDLLDRKGVDFEEQVPSSGNEKY